MLSYIVVDSTTSAGVFWASFFSVFHLVTQTEFLKKEEYNTFICYIDDKVRSLKNE